MVGMAVPDDDGRITVTGDGDNRSPRHPVKEEKNMSKGVDDILMLLRGFTFDGDTGRTIKDLYAAVDGTGCTRDAPFVAPTWLEGDDRPAGLNSYLDPEGKRVHIVWQSDASGLSRVVNVVLDAPSLAREKGADPCDLCDACGIPDMFDMLGDLSES